MQLPTRHIMIDPDQRELLEKDIWSNEYVHAFLITDGIKKPIKLRYRGGHTREYPKRSYEILDGSITTHLNAEYDDPSMIRNALSFEFFRWIGVPCSITKHCHFIMNGQSQGVYLELEAVDRNFFRKRKIAVDSLMYAVNEGANFSLIDIDTGQNKTSLFRGYELMIGNQRSSEQLKSFIFKINTLKGKELYRYLSIHLDIDNYLRWLAGAVFTGNYDGFRQNYSIYRHKNRRVFRMIPWDYEGTWGRNCYGKEVENDLVRIQGYNTLTRKLLAFESVRRKYKSIVRHILRSHFTVSKLSPVIDELYEQIAVTMYHDRSRKWTFDLFEGEPRYIQNYIHERRQSISSAISRL